jgi:glycosyltransferase involved in cell wall biosynthesis
MPSRRPLIFVSPRVPWPLNSGAKIRTRALLDALTVAYETHYVGFLQPDLTEAEARRQLDACAGVALFPEPATTPAGKALLGLRSLFDARPATMMKYDAPAVAAEVARMLAFHPGAIVHADHLHMAVHLSAAKAPRPGGSAEAALRVIDEHNVETQIVERAAQTFRLSGLAGTLAGPPTRSWLQSQARKMRRHEAAWVGRADLTLAVSPGDAEQLRAMAPGADVEVVPNGVDVDYFAPPPEGRRPTPGRLVFTGSMNWLPNQDAMLYFCREILPVLRAQHGPGDRWSLDIVGQSPPPSVQALAGPRVRVTGIVDDVRPYAHEAEMFIVPLRIGGGSRLKILEAFALGVPVVSTTVGCEGLDATDGEQLLIADGAEAFAAAIARLSGDAGLRAALAERARRHALEHFSWAGIGRRLLAIYEDRLARRARR